jgi:hypothetical protein
VLNDDKLKGADTAYEIVVEPMPTLQVHDIPHVAVELGQFCQQTVISNQFGRSNHSQTAKRYSITIQYGPFQMPNTSSSRTLIAIISTANATES